MKEALVNPKIAILAKAKGFPGQPELSQSVLQRWLRETFEIHISISAWKDMDHITNYRLTIEKHVDTGPIFDKSLRGLDILETVPLDRDYFPSYEIALEAGLVISMLFLSDSSTLIPNP